MLWIGSVKEGEITNGTSMVDSERFYNRFKIIALLDGDFFESLQYGSLFLASISKKIDYATDILITAEKNAKDKNRILELEVLERICYEKPINLARLNSINISSNNGFLTTKEMVEFANTQNTKEQVQKNNLDYLLDKAKNEAQKKQITREINSF